LPFALTGAVCAAVFCGGSRI